MSHPGKYELVQSAISMRLVRVIDDRCEIDLHLHDSCLKTTAIDFREILHGKYINSILIIFTEKLQKGIHRIKPLLKPHDAKSYAFG
ncbi:hypothetical protein V1478_001245 [Vespula squamosa]|uniref:Uncharacterized protein n=1 Tax=Vespula squamosa TaxID=30214 RepID=A0ABD2C3Y9_VESSQ